MDEQEREKERSRPIMTDAVEVAGSGKEADEEGSAVKADAVRAAAGGKGSEICIPRIPVEYPGQEAEREQRRRILALSLPEEKPFWSRLREIYLGPGLPVIFYQCRSAWLIGLMVYLVAAFGCIELQYIAKYRNFLVLLVFPLLSLAFSAASCRWEEQNEVIDLKKSLRYSFFYVVTLRMFWGSIASILLNIGVMMLFVNDLFQIWSVCAIGISGTFLFSVLSVYLYHRTGRYWHMLLMAGAWTAVCGILAKEGGFWDNLLFEVIPLGVHLFVAVCCFIGYMKMVASDKKYIEKGRVAECLRWNM